MTFELGMQQNQQNETEKTVVVDFFLQTDTYILILKSDIWLVSFFSFKYMKIPPPVSAPIRWLLCLLHSKCVLLTLGRVLFWTNRAVLTVVR